MALTPAVIAEADRIMASDAAVNLKVLELNDLWLSNGLASKQVHGTERFCIHPQNRGGAMMNSFDMVTKGETMMSQGLRIDLLETSAVAFCMSSNAVKRDKQLAANRKCCSQAKGVMPEVVGDELFLTVGSSHSTCYLKSMKQGLVKNASSFMNKGQPVERCLSQGWTWLILADTLEDQFPSLPLLYSSVLNSNNSVCVASTEIECLATISNCLKLGKTVAEATAATMQGEPACKEYLETVAFFAQKYTGGDEMPLVDFLVSFSKLYGQSIRLGQEFTQLITYFDFKLEANLAPCFRVACMAAQLASPKVQDQFAKLLVKADLDRIKSKSKPELLEAERLLKDAWVATQNAPLKDGERYTVFGRCCVRTVLYLSQKQKFGRENKEWNSLEEINQALATELLGPKGTSSSAAPTASPSKVANLLEASPSTVAMMQHPHLEVGGLYQHSDYGSQVFQLLELNDTSAKFEHRPLMQDAWTVAIALSDDLKQWKKTKKAIVQVVDQAALSKYLVENNSAAGEAIDMQRMQILLYDTFVNLPEVDGFSFVSPPTGLCATINIPKGKLKLIAYGDLKRDDGKPGHKVSGYALSPPKAVGDMDNVTATSVLVPFWYVKPSMDAEAVNMQLTNAKHGGLAIPCYTNSRSIRKGELLLHAAEALLAKEASKAAPKKRKAS
ncbi:unnamed protein product [Symbiodinium sp. CCMP2592]|nr:unnamed protein product [Symbiodinium sp. CCMP2592]